MVNFSIAVTGERKKNQATGKWEEVPCFIDCKAFDSASGEGRKSASLISEYFNKGDLIFCRGKLVLETWESDGQKRRAHKMVVEDWSFAGGSKKDGETGGGQSKPKPNSQQSEYDRPPDDNDSDGDIPF